MESKCLLMTVSNCWFWANMESKCLLNVLMTVSWCWSNHAVLQLCVFLNLYSIFKDSAVPIMYPWAAPASEKWHGHFFSTCWNWYSQTYLWPYHSKIWSDQFFYHSIKKRISLNFFLKIENITRIFKIIIRLNWPRSRLIRIYKPSFLNQKCCLHFFKPCLQQKVVRPWKSKNTKYPQKWYGQTYVWPYHCFGRITVKSGSALAVLVAPLLNVGYLSVWIWWKSEHIQTCTVLFGGMTMVSRSSSYLYVEGGGSDIGAAFFGVGRIGLFLGIWNLGV